MTAEPISSYEQLAALAHEWSALVDRCPAATVFQRPEWLLPWWRHSGSGRMFALAFRDAGRLVGLMPAFIHEWEGRRQCTLMGTGPTDHLDLIAEPQHSSDCARRVFEALRSVDWDVCDWQDVPSESTLLAVASEGIRREVAECGPCTELALASRLAGYEESLPRGIRRNIRRYGERLRLEHGARFDTVHDDQSGILLARLFELHAARWNAKGESGMLSGREAFLRDATCELARSNLLRMHVLYCGGIVAGVIYQIAYRDRAYAYISGFDPALETYSPGTLLLDHALRSAVSEGVRYWDFLRGRERYKLQWGAAEKPNYRLKWWSTPA
jgi:CelD/BcsL family acetyltransferase involved in cellulose biosynthesis